MEDKVLLIKCKSCGNSREINFDYFLNNSKISIEKGKFDLDEFIKKNRYRFKCSVCGEKNIYLYKKQNKIELDENIVVEQKHCIECKKLISKLRLIAVPETNYCIECMKKMEGKSKIKDEPIYCKKCGAPMVERFRKKTGLTKYFLGCSNYPKCQYTM
ncbi:MAG: topoisomerase DNA-binding C4 zinc finger domain-containing protein [Candidatus Delongbacteria bacterium]|jgi:DNA-directed RNA polymerase subunit M/transcription elongation factor TFIIS|nr:topoisomerase DNA-binding C4 zinc finger domain-containing protein [Candidatus Delongbacteria bacterium]